MPRKPRGGQGCFEAVCREVRIRFALRFSDAFYPSKIESKTEIGGWHKLSQDGQDQNFEAEKNGFAMFKCSSFTHFSDPLFFGALTTFRGTYV